MSKGNDVDTGVKATIATVTGHECYLLVVPEEPDVPYTVISPLPQPRGDGSWADPEEDRDFVYQVSSVGYDTRQVRRIQELVEEAFLGRAGGGDYEHAIDAGAGNNVQWRMSDQLGAIVRSGDKLFKSDDTYRVRVGK